MKKIILTGNVGRDPEVRVDQAGSEFATFSVGVSVGTKQNPKTDWVDISCGGKLVDIAKNYIRKGSKLLIEGYPSINAYLTKDNKPAATIRVYANTIELLSRREDDNTISNMNIEHPNESVYQLPESDNQVTLKSDDIPF
jgi:single-strand DNA-binding protein